MLSSIFLKKLKNLLNHWKIIKKISYLSQFYSIELIFRAIKFNIYKENFKTLKGLESKDKKFNDWRKNKQKKL